MVCVTNYAFTFYILESPGQTFGKLASITVTKDAQIFAGFKYAITTLTEEQDGTKTVERYKFENGKFVNVQSLHNIKNMPSFSFVSYKHTAVSGRTYLTYTNTVGQSTSYMNPALTSQLGTPTLAIYDADMNLLEHQPCEGALVGVKEGKWLIFDDRYEKNENNSIIVKSIKDMHIVHRLDCTFTLNTQEDWIRACGHSDDDRIAVVFREQQRLDVFGSRGNVRYIPPDTLIDLHQ